MTFLAEANRAAWLASDASAWEEKKHKRDNSGQFSKTAGGGGAKKTKPKKDDKPEKAKPAAGEKEASAAKSAPSAYAGEKGSFVPEAIFVPYKPKKDLNEEVWNEDQKLRGYVKDGLSDIADEFIKAIGIERKDIDDIQLVGSMASYAYRQGSDLDLHLILPSPEGLSDVDKEKRKLIQAKAAAFRDKWKDQLFIGDMPVECSVEEMGGPTVSSGRWSLKSNKWVREPEKSDVKAPSRFEVARAAGKFIRRIKDVLKSDDLAEIEGFLKQVYKERREAFQKDGEWGMNNIMFKIARSRGLLQKLWDRADQLKAEKLSVKKPDKGDPSYDEELDEELFKSVGEDEVAAEED